MKYLALGDSYTIGEGVPAEGRWPTRLAQLLREDGVALEAPRVIATTGWTTDELCAAIDGEEPLGRFDFVTLLIGVNNQYRGRSVAEYRGEFGDLLRRAVGYAGGDPARVMVLSIPDWGVTPFAREQGRDAAQVAAEIDAYNDAARAVAERLGVAFVDITGISRERGTDDDMLIADRLHPSAAMHALWTDAALPVARKLLASG
ncbi:MAG TPA: SGNH/GDSL hydrolase family protein [Xanthomonadaceae bacterium]|nr:SGNH/GDSL hydrolase family protein [Xanthomonadaceae bacterium]